MSEPRESREWQVSVERPHNPAEHPPLPKRAAPAAAAVPDGEKVAVLVAHGMGQQVPFETLELVARAIREGEQEDRGDDPPFMTRLVMLEGQEFPRSEVTVQSRKGVPRTVHLYEAYWAPLTEGKVNAREAAAFLLKAGWSGIGYSLPFFPLQFRRWMFGRPITLPFDTTVSLQFAGILAVLVSVMLIFLITIPTLAARVLTGGPAALLQSQLLRHASAEAATLLIVTLLGGLLAFAIPRWLRGPRLVQPRIQRQGALAARRAARAQRRTAWPVMALAWGGVALILVFLVLTAADIVGHVTRPGHRALMEFFFLTRWIEESLPLGPWAWPTWILVGLTWAAAVWVSYKLRSFLIQFVGDLAAYLTAHTVSKFAEVRRDIHRATECIFEAVYKLRREGGIRPEYDRVIVVGHSLGSVIAYDGLNALMLRDQLENLGLDVPQRTRLFLTFGSPLDKTAFIFRTQGGREAGVREALAAAKQPMIVSYADRPLRWINLWSPNDWISGSLEYYDDPKQKREPRRVINVKDHEASTPLAAHSEYWENRAFRRLLRRAVTS